MLPTYGSALLLCGLALVIGRGVLAASGYERWSWLAAPVGCAIVVVVADVAARAPGGETTAVVAILAVAGAALVLPRLIGSSIGWPPVEGLGVALVVLVALATPFVANSRFGILGVGFNNDPSFHLLWAEQFRNHAEAPLAPFSPGYPVGPHAVVALLAELLGTSVDRSFDGLLIATPVLIALTALEWLRDLDRSRRWLVAVLAALSYLLASWYAQAAFKEPLLALFVLACALVLADAVGTRVAHAARVGVPAGVLLVGILYTYGYLGVLWPAATVAVWLALAFTVGGAWRDAAVVRRYARPVAIVGAVVAGLVAVGVAADAHRILDFVNALGFSPATGQAGIPVDNIGNLVGRLHALETFGIWLGEDFRLTAVHSHTWPVLAALVCAFGVVWALRRRELVLTAALLACGAIALETRETQSAYVAAKAMVVAAPFVVLVASRPLLHRLDAPAAWRRWSTWLVAAVAILYLSLSFKSSYLALRGAHVGPSADYRELRALRPVLGDSPTLDMVFDDFFRWNLLGAQVSIPGLVGPVGAPYRPEKPWLFGQSLDFDSFDAGTLDRFRYVITSRTAAQSQPPSNFHVVARSPRYEVWRRVGPTPARQVLPESGTFGAVLRCDTAAGRRLAETPGVALVRSAPVASSGLPPLAPGASATVLLTLPSGTWDVSLVYDSPQAVRIVGGGSRVTMPATFSRLGTLWHVWTMRSTGRPIAVTMRVENPAHIHTSSQAAHLLPLLAVRAGPGQEVPLSRACGRFVDWYRTAR